MSSIKHFELHISGKVQGVFYRKSCLAKANDLGIKGIVKNLTNGQVYCEAEGDIEKLIYFLDWCKEGPHHAVVDSVKNLQADVKGYTDFKIIE